MLTIDGSRYSGSGTIVRQAVAFSALTRKPIRIVNVRARRSKPGLRPQHVAVVESIRRLSGGEAKGVFEGSREVEFRPGEPASVSEHACDIGSAGSTTALALSLIPVLAFRARRVEVELRGGVFQDFAPSFYHLEEVMLPLLRRLGIAVTIRMERPGYVPVGGGILRLSVEPVRGALAPVVLDKAGRLERLWGIALSSRLRQRRVSERIAEAARKSFARRGLEAEIGTLYDETALQPGAAFAAFADLEGGARLGADRAGAPGRRSEAIGEHVARRLLEEIDSGATLDRFAADQIVPFASLAEGESRFRLSEPTDHVLSSAWLAEEFLGAKVIVEGQDLIVRGAGFRAEMRE